MSFESQSRAWSTEKLKELYSLRYDKRMTYDQLVIKLHRSSEDIVNALAEMRCRREEGADPFAQIGSDEGVRKAQEWEERFEKRRQKHLRGGEATAAKMKERRLATV